MINGLIQSVRRPPWRCVVPLPNVPAGRIGPRNYVADIPHRACGEANDRLRENRTARFPALPHVYSIGLHTEHLTDLLRTGEISGIVHGITVGERHAHVPSARRRPKPTEISYSGSRTAVRWKGFPE